MRFTFPNHCRQFLLAGSLLLSSAASAQWVTQRPPSGMFSLTDVHFTDADHGYASAAIGGLMKTSNGGQSWVDVPTGVQSSLRDVFFVTPDSGYVVGNVGVIIRTVNGGQTWQRRDLANSGSSVNGVYAHSGRRALVTQGDQIYSTNDGGATWTSVYTYNGPLSIFTFRFLEFVNHTTGYAVGGYSGSFGNVSQVVKTTDGGRNWQLLPSLAGTSPMGGAAAAAFPTEQVGYVADVQDRLFRTADGGQTWTIMGQRTFGSFYGMYFTNAQTGYGVGFNGNLQHTTDGGLTWTSQSLNQVDTYAAVYFPTPQVGYAAGSDAGALARVLKYTAAVSGTSKANTLTGLAVYPNPATTAVKLTGLPAGQAVRATVYGVDGRQVQVSVLASGENQLATDALAAGRYVLRLESGRRSYQQRLVIN
jgi:photosystem II stability/assembly factor-like uncharacterized protein